MTDIAELKIAIDKANREMYEAFVAGRFNAATTHAIELEKLACAAKWTIGRAELDGSIK